MRVRVTYDAKDMSIDEVFSGATPEAVVASMQRTAASKVGFALRFFVNAMTPTQFAQEVVRRYNEATGKSVPRPGDCAEFIRLGEEQGLATVLEE